MFMISDPEGISLQENSLITILPELKKTFTISFDINFKKISSDDSEYRNIIHLTADNTDRDSYGSRVPGVWTISPGVFFVASAINRDMNRHWYGYSNPINVGRWINVQVEQYLDSNGLFQFDISIDEVRKVKYQNNDARVFEDVYVYVSDPWHPPADAVIRNFKIIQPGIIEPTNNCPILPFSTFNVKHNKHNI